MNNDLIKGYYNELLKLNALDDDEAKQNLTSALFSKILNKNQLFKFISITSDQALNDKKILCLQHDSVWCSAHYLLRKNDPSEFDLNIDIERVERHTTYSKQDINEKIHTFKELSDLCCFSSELNEFMWQTYANNHSGICCVFEIIENKNLMPVLYCKKCEIDFTQQVIDVITNIEPTPYRPNICALNSLYILSTLPFVIKDKQKYENENEIRFLTGDAYLNKNGPLLGFTKPGIKEEKGYKGMTVSYQDCGLKLTAVIFGKNIPEYEKSKIENILINKENIILSNEV